MKCDYGCGQEARYKFKNEKFCCRKKAPLCPNVSKEAAKKRTGEKNPFYGKHHSEDTKKYLSKIRIGKEPWNKNKYGIYSKETLEQMSLSKKGKYIPWNIGLRNWLSEDALKSKSEKMKKVKISEHVKEVNRKRCLEGHAKYMNSFIKPETRKKNRLEMLNGKSVYIQSFIQNPSKPQVYLKELVSKICPYVYMNLPIYRGKGKRNYSIDIAVPKLNLAIEFDGWYHFGTDERKKKDIERQRELEEDGWKFLRYNIFQKFPTLEQVKKDILEITNASI